MTALFVSLLANHLYDRYKRRSDSAKERKRLESLIAQQGENIRELEELLKTERRATRKARESLRFHKDVLAKAERRERSLNTLFENSLEVLRTQSDGAIRKYVDSHSPILTRIRTRLGKRKKKT